MFYCEVRVPNLQLSPLRSAQFLWQDCNNSQTRSLYLLHLESTLSSLFLVKILVCLGQIVTGKCLILATCKDGSLNLQLNIAFRVPVVHVIQESSRWINFYFCKGFLSDLLFLNLLLAENIRCKVEFLRVGFSLEIRREKFSHPTSLRQ